MASVLFRGVPVHTVGELPAVGEVAPSFRLVGLDLTEIDSSQFRGSRVVLNVFASADTRVCAMSARRFNELAGDLSNTVVVCVSMDLPFALNRFCLVQGLDKVVVGSGFRSGFGEDFGVTILDGPPQGLFARAVVVLDEAGTVMHTQLVPDVMEQPDYESALRSIGWSEPDDLIG